MLISIASANTDFRNHHSFISCFTYELTGMSRLYIYNFKFWTMMHVSTELVQSVEWHVFDLKIAGTHYVPLSFF